MIERVLIIGLSLLMLACGGRSGKKNNANEQESVVKVESIERPTPPSMMDGMDKAVYLANHFWDNFDFKNRDYINQDVTESYLVDYINLLNHLPTDVADKALRVVLERVDANSEVYDYFNEMFEKYLNDEQSPVRNEELYISTLRKLIDSEKIDSLNKIRPKEQLRLGLKNRVGDIAADIKITLADGSSLNIHRVKAEYTLLYFNNPDCSSCAQTQAGLLNTPIIRSMTDNGRMKVVMIYPDEDMEGWRANLNKVPAGWINGYDKALDIRTNDTYNIPAIPSLYLLDSSKRVLIKDAPTYEVIADYFERAELGR